MRNIRLEVLRRVTAFLLVFFIAGSGFGLSGCSSKKDNQAGTVGSTEVQSTAVADDMASLVYQGEPYVVINDNNPDFTEADMTTASFESYGELDGLGRCTTAYANIGKDLMPTEKRGSIGEVKPTGWQTAKYDNVDGKYLYNRCHLIGYQLTGENANAKNLITGTRYMNVEGMLPFEDEVAAYIKETDNHVMYRVTPVFEGDDLIASGVQMQAESVEDDGVGISFNVYVYNVQPYVVIDYKTGENWEGDEIAEPEGKWADGTEAEPSDTKEQMYILNKNTKKFHKPECSGAKKIKAKNKDEYTGSRQTLIDEGYEPCGNCHP